MVSWPLPHTCIYDKSLQANCTCHCFSPLLCSARGHCHSQDQPPSQPGTLEPAPGLEWSPCLHSRCYCCPVRTNPVSRAGTGRLGACVAGVLFGICGSHGGRQLYLGKKGVRLGLQRMFSVGEEPLLGGGLSSLLVSYHLLSCDVRGGLPASKGFIAPRLRQEGGWQAVLCSPILEAVSRRSAGACLLFCSPLES